MKKLTVLLALVFLVSACGLGIRGNGEVTTRSVQISNFAALDISGGFDVEINQGEAFNITVTTDENIHPYLDFIKKGNTLVVKNRENIAKYTKLVVKIQMPNLEEIEASGAVTLRTNNTFNGETLKLEFSGAQESNLMLNYEDIEISSSGASQTTLSGTAEKLTIDGSGACKVKTKDLKVQEAELDFSGAGNAVVNVEDNLSVKISGAGEVRYVGSPAIKSDISGAGTLLPAK